MNAMVTTYEEQLEKVDRLTPATSENDRHIDWCVGDRGPVGMAINPHNQIEIFIEGLELQANHRAVRAALEYQEWYRGDGSKLYANRILLPSAAHYHEVAAFLCNELIRNGATTNAAEAFARTEPLIEMAISELLLADDALLGLSGEMLLLKAIVQAAPPERLGDLIHSWKGNRETARDFQLGPIGVEVKTTTGLTSSHMFRGVHQLELGHGVDDAEESIFMLMSLGLAWVSADDDEGSYSLPDLVDDVVRRLSEALGDASKALIDDLIQRIADYGPHTVTGYDHTTMAWSSRFTRRFRLVFSRGYDMSDKGIQLLTTDDMRLRPSIDVESLHMRVNFPDVITGDVNPVSGLPQCVTAILRHAP